ncbi:cell division protein FtsL [Candidatus Pelagibacter sp.]|nr:cell division protein FtsL [Candidatus Pelagibacter sp.]
MKKILTISLIFSLIVITSFIKNSTKKIDEELFSLKENILNLNLELDNVKLEFDYLSSSEKLLSYQNLYFENKLTLKNINEIEIIQFTKEKILTNNVKIIDSEK